MDYIPPGYKVCFQCERKYDPSTSIGSMRCYFHPSPPDSTFHYPCCGASMMRDDRTHRELHNPVGCHPVDHATTWTEQQRYRTLPYVIIPKSSAKNIESLQLWHPEKLGHVLIDSPLKLSSNYMFQGVLEEEIRIDLYDVYEQLKREIDARVLARQGKVTTNYYQYPSGNKDKSTQMAAQHVDDKAFAAFYIVRRCGSEIDQVRMRYVLKDKPCVIKTE